MRPHVSSKTITRCEGTVGIALDDVWEWLKYNALHDNLKIRDATM